VVEVEQKSLGKGMEAIDGLLDAYGQWLRVAGRSDDSVQDHVWKLNRLWDFLDDRGLLVDGRVNLPVVDADTMAGYQAHLFETVSPHTGKKLSCNTQINLLSYVATFFRFLEKTGRIGTNPADVIKLPRHPRLLPAVMLTSEETRRLLGAPDVKTVMGFRDRTILEVLWSSAPRLGELVRLRPDDLNLPAGLITIREGKGDKERVLPLGRGACAWAAEYLRSVRPLMLKKRPTDALFISKLGGHMHKTSWMVKLDVYLHRARIRKNFGSHGFRHMLATEMLRNGADLRHIQQMLGHEDLVTTQRYLHVVKAELRRVHHQTHPKEQAPAALVRYGGGWNEE
jgi:integrase/recombinase XerD